MTALRDRQKINAGGEEEDFLFSIFHFSERDAADDNDKLQLVGMISRK